MPKNASLHMSKCPEDLTREVIKEKVEDMGVTVAYIDFNKGDTEGYIRLHEANSVSTVSTRLISDPVYIKCTHT